MKKALLVFAGIIVLALIAFLCFSASVKKSLAKIENAEIDMSLVQNGTYTGHSELGPVVVDVAVTVEDHKIKSVDLVRHDCGLGHPADVIVEQMTAQNTYDVDAVSGATISSNVIKNAVNKALLQGKNR